MADLRKIIGTNLKTLRGVRKMQQVDLAAAADVDRGYISKIENGRYSPSATMIEKLTKALEVEAWELLHPDTAQKYKSDAG